MDLLIPQSKTIEAAAGWEAIVSLPETVRVLTPWDEILSLQVGHSPDFAPCSDGVYLLCFDEQYKHARHYIGWSLRIFDRLGKHLSGHGAGITRAIREAGIGFTVARVWFGETHSFERSLHDRKETRKLCPICSGPAAYRRAIGTPWGSVGRASLPHWGKS